MSKILIVDDEQDFLDLVAACIKNLSVEVFTALDAKTGWSIYEKVKPDIVITDYAMPEVDGYVLACLIEKDEHPSSVILVTGHENIDEKLKSQFNYIFPKPLDVVELLACIKSILKI